MIPHAFFPSLLLTAIACGLVNGRGVAGQEELPPGLAELRQRTDELRFEEFVRRSTVESEAFRRRLLTADNDGQRPMDLLAKATVQFVEVINPMLPSDARLDRFELNAAKLTAIVADGCDVSAATAAYESFAGRWYGLWDGNKVDHHWGPFVTMTSPTRFEMKDGESVRLLGYQYAWIGDGYALNHLSADADGSHPHLLGYAVHLRDGHIDQETARRPHIGIPLSPTQLIWMTAGEVFLEEIQPASDDTPATYIITGFNYQQDDHTLTATHAFQAVYSRKPNNRRPWRAFEIDLKIPTTDIGSSHPAQHDTPFSRDQRERDPK